MAVVDTCGRCADQQMPIPRRRSASNHRTYNGVGPEGLEPSTYGLKVRSSAY